MWVSEMLVTALVSVLLLLVEHWMPWHMLFKRQMPRVLAYILGVLALAMPLSVLLTRWRDYQALAALWAVVAAGGLAVMLAYLADYLLAKITLAQELAELVEHHERSNGPEGRQIED